MIVLKHLANEFDIDPYPLRMKLRRKFGKRRRWRWDPNNADDAKQLKAVRDFLRTSIADKSKPR